MIAIGVTKEFVMKAVFICMSVICLLLAGCDNTAGKFEIVRAGNQTFLLNKATGESKLIDGTSLIAVKSPDASPSDKGKEWPDLTIPQLGDVSISIRTKYRDGRMLYTATATPFQGRLQKDFQLLQNNYALQPLIIIDLTDSDEFRVGEPLELKLRGATRIVNNKGEAYSLSWTGTQAMSAESYKAIFSQSVRWAGFSKD
jgi:hypothetical protein